MYGYIPVSLILAGTDPYGPTGEFAGRKPHRLLDLDWLRLFRTRRPAPKATRQPEPVQCHSRA